MPRRDHGAAARRHDLRGAASHPGRGREKIGSEEYQELLLRLAEATPAKATSNDIHVLRESPGRLARDRWGAGQVIQDADVGPRPQLVDVEVDRCPAPPDIAEALGLGPDQLALCRSRQFMLADRTVQAAISWLDLGLVADTPIASTESGPGGIYARLAELGHEPVRFREVVRAEHADRDGRTELELQTRTRTFAITRYAYDSGGRCVEVNEMTLDADVYVLAYDFPA
jgi:GntR family transcriptional regulator